METLAHLRMGFFHHPKPVLTPFLALKRYNALKWCKTWGTAEWQQARCPMLGRSLTH
ncbi:hypothetical protein CSSP291_18750 [Cronobacter sakazakii SP291]|nr:hypothetical protein CSSP291_18750 [Cronobacter sakazakii SP291]